MELVKALLLALHVGAGILSLLLFWVPVFTRKGGGKHRKAGKFYVYCMWVIVVTAIGLSVKNFFQGNAVMAIFLGFLSLITAKPLWVGVAILKNKRFISRNRLWGMLCFNGTVVCAGIALIVYGLTLPDSGTAWLIFAFGALGISNVFEMSALVRGASQNEQWLRHHIISLCASGIAAHTAFLVIGTARISSEYLLGYWALVPWLAPTLIGIFGIRIAVNSYRKKGMIPTN